jgi:dihydroneopterin triphosphate diphosphatase
MTYKRPVSVLVLVYTRGGEVLLLRRRYPPDFWQSVTGGLEWGEMPPQAARRELREETGIRAVPRYCRIRNQFRIAPHWRHRYAPHASFNREHVFALELPHACDVRLDPGEHTEYRWLPWAAALRLASSWTNRKAIREVLGGARGTGDRGLPAGTRDPGPGTREQPRGLLAVAARGCAAAARPGLGARHGGRRG